MRSGYTNSPGSPPIHLPPGHLLPPRRAHLAWAPLAQACLDRGTPRPRILWFVRVPNDLKCYENHDFTCLGAGTHHGRSPLQNLNLAGKLIWGNITLFNHYLSRANHQQTQKIIDFNMSFCIKKSMHLQNVIIFSILLDVSARAGFS